MRRVALAIFGTIAGLVGLLTFKTHEPTVATPAAAVAPATPGPSSTASSSATSSTATSSTATSSTSKTTATSSSSSKAATSKTVTGDAADTRWGPVQVKITVTNGKVTSATAVEYPENNGRDQEINATAVPTLQQESIGVTKASSVDAVSGATYTSDGYLQSLQSALDKAGV